MIEYLGGKCLRCGWTGHSAGYDIHHVDPTKKEFGLSQTGQTRKWSVIQRELDKCVLLCRNCHSIIHTINEVKWFDESIIPEYQEMEVRQRGRRPKTICLDCDKEITWGSLRCQKHASILANKPKIDWPAVDVLLEMVSNNSLEEVSRTLGVSSSAIRGHLSRRGHIIKGSRGKRKLPQDKLQ